MLLAGACGPQMGAIWYHFGNPSIPVDAEYKLGKGPLLILADSLGPRPVGDVETAIIKAITAEFHAHEINDQIIPARRLAELRRVEPDYAKLSAAALGKRLGAEQVLHLQVMFTAAQQTSEGDVMTGASCRADVRVVNPNATEREDVRLWPPGPPNLPGKGIEAKITVHQARYARTPDGRAKVLAAALADRVARLFYDHKITPENRGPDP